MKDRSHWLFLVPYLIGMIASNIKASTFGLLPGAVIVLVLILVSWHFYLRFLNRYWTRKS